MCTVLSVDEHVLFVGTSHGSVFAHSAIDGAALDFPLQASTFDRQKIVMMDTVDEFGRPISDFGKFSPPIELKDPETVSERFCFLYYFWGDGQEVRYAVSSS